MTVNRSKVHPFQASVGIAGKLSLGFRLSCEVAKHHDFVEVGGAKAGEEVTAKTVEKRSLKL